MIKVAQLLVKCLEDEGVSSISGMPEEENIDLLEFLLRSLKVSLDYHKSYVDKAPN
ncbi:hypothetical protein [Halobacillus mangrovi]|uniref:hypothetical protein n=1 Tax=Halobacillus mangrovi TaxID=402384 RepID=UPI0012F4A8AB|nr:hypothetical protein [Halobacillus mangrovi]